MEYLKLFMRAYVAGMDISHVHYSTDNLLKNYINLNQALDVCGHETPELTKAISDCQEAINKHLMRPPQHRLPHD